MKGALLTIDLGNSSGSAARVLVDDLARAHDAAALRLHAWAGDEAGRESGRDSDRDSGVERGRESESDAVALAIERAQGLGIDLAVLSAVGSHARELVVLELLTRAGIDVIAQPSSGLLLDIDHPETCGPDRQYAMRAALARAPLALVVDAGTALTVDAGQRTGDEGTFRGGAIALGPGAAARAMSDAGARLPRFAIDPDAPALGRSTVDALRSGVAVGFRGAVRELAGAIATEAFGSLEGVTPFLTGGARDFARAPLHDLFGAQLVEDPLLVHRGLALAGLDALARPR